MAAIRLGMVSSGVARVRLEILAPTPSPLADASFWPVGTLVATVASPLGGWLAALPMAWRDGQGRLPPGLLSA